MPKLASLAALLFASALPPLFAQEAVVLADFESGLGGFTGKITPDTTQAKVGKGSGKITAELANVTQSAWVTVSRPLDFKTEIKSLSFWVKSAEAKQITVKIVDATGQTLQQRPAIKPDGAWQQITVAHFAKGPGFQAFGGAADKIPHWPARSLSFVVDKNALAGGSGTVWLDQVEVVLGNDRIVGKLDLGQERLGNVFLTTEPVRLPVETQGDTVAWTVTDFSGTKVAEGSSPVSDKRALIAPDIRQPGHFEIAFTALQGGATLAAGNTSFVVTRPFDLAQVKDSPFGVMTHFAQNWNTDVIPVIARAGIKHIRDELYWGHVEEQKGVFAFKPQFENYMAAAKSSQLDPLVVLSFGSKHYDHTHNAPGYGNAPYTDEGRAAYARYGREVLKHYGPQIKAVEIWNEYNGTFGRGPAAKDKAKYYFEMLKVSYETLKKDRPDATVVGVSAVAVPFPYFEDLFQRGALRYMDALSLHPYRTLSTPEGLERHLNKLQALVKKYNNGKPMPIWVTELGWYVKGPDGRSDVIVTEADQAKYLVRGITLTLSAGVEKFYWYHARDDKSFPSSGLLRSPEDPKGRYAPKASYAAYATLTRQLHGAKFDRREPTLNDETYSLLFNRGTETGRVLWSLQPAALTVKAAGPLTVVDLMGVSRTLQPAGGEVTLQVSDAPLYVWGEITALPPLQKSAGELVADSEEEFSSRQGDDGWSYGFFVAPAPGGPYAPASWQPLPRYQTTIWGYDWIGDQKYLTLSPRTAHPSSEGGKPVWAVRRWTSDVAGNVRLKGKLGRPEKGDGTTARIFVDGKEVWTRQIGGGQPSTASFDFVTPVKTGSLVDFAIDPGPAADTSYDATSTTVTITHLR